MQLLLGPWRRKTNSSLVALPLLLGDENLCKASLLSGTALLTNKGLWNWLKSHEKGVEGGTNSMPFCHGWQS